MITDMEEELGSVNLTNLEAELGLMNLIGLEKEQGSVNPTGVGEGSGSVITGVDKEPRSVNLAKLEEGTMVYESHLVR